MIFSRRDFLVSQPCARARARRYFFTVSSSSSAFFLSSSAALIVGLVNEDRHRAPRVIINYTISADAESGRAFMCLARYALPAVKLN